MSREPLVTGSAVIYRLYDVGYEISLESALHLLSSSAPERARPVRGEAQALQILNPPVTVHIGSESVTIADRTARAEITARLFDFGVVSMRARIEAPPRLPWQDFTNFAAAVDEGHKVPALLDDRVRALVDRTGTAIKRRGIAPVNEDYAVYRMHEVFDPEGGRATAAILRDVDLAPLLLSETRALSPEARAELLPHRFSYYSDDLAVLTWENALIVDPVEGSTEIEYVLEFANAQLLELRYYDSVLDAELPKLYDRIGQARYGPRGVFRHRYSRLLGEMQTLVADSTELVERVENAMKVTDDVYLARVYSTALELFRGRAWRTGIDRKLTIIRDTYAMLNAEAQAGRAETLELAIVLLIVAEIVLSFIR